LAHPIIENRTPFVAEPVFIADEELRPVVVIVIKATFTFDSQGNVRLADEQLPVNLTGEFATDAPVSSYRYEPEVAMCKLSTDLVLIGHAQPPDNSATQVDVGFRVGAVQKRAKVFGDRYWVWTTSGVVMSRPARLQAVSLIWENAFGGSDAVRSTPERQLFETRNPVGTGFGTPLQKDGDRLRLPNIEDPKRPIRDYGVAVPPWGFGFISPDWLPRAGYAGTYDEQWDKTRKPLLPVDFDRRFFNAAAPGLVAPGYLRGDETVVVLNTTPVQQLAFGLPGVAPPFCRIVLRKGLEHRLSTNLDTVIVNTDEQLLLLLWRAYAPAGNGPHDVAEIQVVRSN
jgi:hypothetical protein